MKTCVFAGSFDPFTKGHAFVVDKCLEIFDKVIIAVGVNADKKPMLSEHKRISLIEKIYDDKRVSVESFDGMLVDFMKKKGVKVTVRGIRNQDDYKYETTMASYNKDMYPEVITLYIPTPAELSYVSSSAIRNIIELNGNFDAYMPERGAEYLKELLKNK
ncbi:MAG: pantetheine-phosphate adenylyltransferase [Clostridia bacterium]|nr:pantetheine-phosphate adenylyltransferase [Clostridia bacterium]